MFAFVDIVEIMSIFQDILYVDINVDIWCVDNSTNVVYERRLIYVSFCQCHSQPTEIFLEDEEEAESVTMETDATDTQTNTVNHSRQ